MSSSSSSTPPAADNQAPITHYANAYSHRGRHNGTSYYSRYSNNNSKRPGPKSYPSSSHQPFQSSHHQTYQSSHHHHQHQHHHNQPHSYPTMNHHSHPANQQQPQHQQPQQQQQLPDENLVRYLHNAWTSAVSTGSIKTFHESADTSSTANSNTATIFDLDSWFKKQSKSSNQSSTSNSNSVWNSNSKSKS